MKNEDRFANKIRSTYSKKLLAFLLVMFFLTAIFIVIIALVQGGSVIAIIGYVMCGFFNIVSIILICNTLFDYVEVEGNAITKVVFLSRKKEEITKIEKIIHNQNFYDVYIGGKIFVSLNDHDPATTKMLFQFEKHGVDLGKVNAQ